MVRKDYKAMEKQIDRLNMLLAEAVLDRRHLQGRIDWLQKLLADEQAKFKAGRLRHEGHVNALHDLQRANASIFMELGAKHGHS